MNVKQTKTLQKLFTAHRERIEKPLIQELNQSYRNERKKKEPDLRDYFASFQELGISSERFHEYWGKRQTEIDDFKNQKIPAKPKWINLQQKDCKDIREHLRNNANRIGPYQLIQPELLSAHTYSNKKINSVGILPNPQPSESGELIRASTQWPEPFKVKVQSNNSIDGASQWEIRRRMYHFVTPEKLLSPCYAFIKWDSYGWYSIYSKPFLGRESEARLSIEAYVYVTQLSEAGHSGYRFEYPHIFSLGGHNIAKQEFFNVSNLDTRAILLYTNDETLLVGYVYFKTYSRNNAFAILDCDGEDIGMDLWFNFNILYSIF